MNTNDLLTKKRCNPLYSFSFSEIPVHYGNTPKVV